jgi:hypothetical protein
MHRKSMEADGADRADRDGSEYKEAVRGHPSISLLPLSSPTLPLSICIPHPYLCTISRGFRSG